MILIECQGKDLPRSLVASLMVPPAVESLAPLPAARVAVYGKPEAEVLPSGLCPGWR